MSLHLLETMCLLKGIAIPAYAVVNNTSARGVSRIEAMPPPAKVVDEHRSLPETPKSKPSRNASTSENIQAMQCVFLGCTLASSEDEVKKFFASLGSGTHSAEHAASRCCRSGFFNAAHHHAEVARFHDDSNTLGLEDFRKCKCNLLCQAFLNLQPPRKHLGNASKLGKAQNSAVRYVSNVHLHKMSVHELCPIAAHFTLPVKGTKWCSQRENTSISLTMTSSSWSSWNTALLTISKRFSS